MMYRNFRITYDPPPIPTRNCDWHATHDDFDGAPDANDNRYFHGPTEADVKAQVDDWHTEQEDSQP